MALTTKVYVDPTEPTSYNSHINQVTSEYQQEKKSAEHEVMLEAWYMYPGTKEGIGENIQDALELPYYKQLKLNMVVYNKVNITKYFKHLYGKWCKIDTNNRK